MPTRIGRLEVPSYASGANIVHADDTNEQLRLWRVHALSRQLPVGLTVFATTVI